MLLDPLEPKEQPRPLVEQREQIEVTTPFGGFKAFTRDVNTMFTVLGFVLTCLIAYGLLDMKSVMMRQVDAINKLSATLREQNCIMVIAKERLIIDPDACKRMSGQ